MGKSLYLCTVLEAHFALLDKLRRPEDDEPDRKPE
jgi:hypothetical protein